MSLTPFLWSIVGALLSVIAWISVETYRRFREVQKSISNVKRRLSVLEDRYTRCKRDKAIRKLQDQQEALSEQIENIEPT